MFALAIVFAFSTLSMSAIADINCPDMQVQELWTRATYFAKGIPQSAWDDPQSTPAIASGRDYSEMPTMLTMLGPDREEL